MIVHPGCALFLAFSFSLALAQTPIVVPPSPQGTDDNSLVGSSASPSNGGQEELSIDAQAAVEARMAEYRFRRDVAEDSLDGQLELARWCDQQGLALQRVAHLRRALRFSPESQEIHYALGNINVNGQWLTPEQYVKEQKKIAATDSRLDRWSSMVNECMRLIRSQSSEKREQGWTTLEAIDDPSIVTVMESTLLPANSNVAIRGLDLISRFEVREASEILTRTALTDGRTRVRERALCLLADRNPHDYVPALLGELETPVKASFAIRPDRLGNANYEFVLFRRNMQADSVIHFDQDLIQVSRTPNGRNQARLMNDASVRARIAMNQIEQENAAIRTRNQHIQRTLEYATGEMPGRDPEDWWSWWYDQNEIQTLWRPENYTRIEVQDVVLQERPPVTSSPGRSAECLVAGTRIWTDRGPVSVEQVSMGDLVLCWNTEKAEAELQVVLERTERPKTPTWRVFLNGDVIQASGGHYFHVEGRGWTRVRDFESGMAITSAAGKPAVVQRIEPADAQPLFNLVVNGNASYLVGARKVVSHDASMPYLGSRTIEQASAAEQ
jgi:Pretoxin HINT domain